MYKSDRRCLFLHQETKTRPWNLYPLESHFYIAMNKVYVCQLWKKCALYTGNLHLGDLLLKRLVRILTDRAKCVKSHIYLMNMELTWYKTVAHSSNQDMHEKTHFRTRPCVFVTLQINAVTGCCILFIKFCLSLYWGLTSQSTIFQRPFQKVKVSNRNIS